MNRGLLVAALTLAGPMASAGDLEAGQQLHSEHCVRCHGSEMYTREDSIIADYPQLRQRVEQCELALELAWFDNEVDSVAAYLNSAFYQFEQ